MIVCGNCAGRFSADPQSADRTVICPHCGLPTKNQDGDRPAEKPLDWLTAGRLVALSFWVAATTIGGLACAVPGCLVAAALEHEAKYPTGPPVPPGFTWGVFGLGLFLLLLSRLIAIEKAIREREL